MVILSHLYGVNCPLRVAVGGLGDRSLADPQEVSSGKIRNS